MCVCCVAGASSFTVDAAFMASRTGNAYTFVEPRLWTTVFVRMSTM